MRKIDEIFVHCSATDPDWFGGTTVDQKILEIDRWHKARGWVGFGYHLLIDRDGSVGFGRPLERVGAHVRGHNTNSIGICLVGGKGGKETDKFEDHFTTNQKNQLLIQLKSLTTKFPNATILGHNEVANKACPSFNVKDFLNETRFGKETTENLQPRSGGTAAGSNTDLASLLGRFLNAFSGRGS